MNVEKLRKVYKAKPFRPFSICLADGRELRVVHPDFFAMSRDGRTAVVFAAQDDPGQDDMEIIDVPLVTGVGLSRAPGRRQA